MRSSLTLRIIVIPITVALLGYAWLRTARADNVVRLTSQLLDSTNHKVRISAALSLSKLKDQRSLDAFIEALKDSNKTVRGIAARSLGKTVNASTSKTMRSRILDELRSLLRDDVDSFVKKQSQISYDVVKALDTQPPATLTYIHVGAMSAMVPDKKKMRAHMHKTVRNTFKAKSTTMVTDWPGSASPPSKEEMSSNKIQAFHIDGTLLELSAQTSGSSATVTCKVSMLIASYPEKSMFGFLKGGAQVQSSSNEKEVRYAKEDCVAAVISDLVGRKIIPTLNARL